MLHSDHPSAGAFGDWRVGMSQNWSALSAAQLSDVDRRRQQERVAAAKARAQAEHEREQTEAASKAKAIWDNSLPARPDHPYLVRKGVKPHGLRLDSNDRLVVPMRIGDDLVSIQTIDHEGNKRFLKGGRKKGACHIIPGRTEAPLVVAEGYATGATIAEATGQTVVVAFDAGNLEPVARNIQAAYPGVRIIIGADHDQNNIGADKANAAAKAVGEALVVMPPKVGHDWNDHAATHGLSAVAETFKASIQRHGNVVRATPFTMPDPAAIPKRDWIYGRHLIRKFVSLTVAPGAAGKSSLLIADALAMATGRDLLNIPVYGGPLRVWLWNLEDPADELTRRIAATAMHYGVTADDIAGRLFVDSGRDQELCLAQQTRDGIQIFEPVADALVAELKSRRIDVLIVDPFVSSHQVSENDNGAIDAVAKRWGSIADRAGCAIEIVHHLRKTNGMEANAESARGAISLVAAARSVRVLNKMTAADAEKAGLEGPQGYFRVFDDKNNLAPAADHSDWFRIIPVDLSNGDSVGVVTRWAWPNSFEGVTVADLLAVQKAIHGKGYRASQQSPEWVGHAIAEVLGLDSEDTSDLARIKTVIKAWTANGALVKAKVLDQNRKERPAIEVGTWANAEPAAP